MPMTYEERQARIRRAYAHGRTGYYAGLLELLGPWYSSDFTTLWADDDLAVRGAYSAGEVDAATERKD